MLEDNRLINKNVNGFTLIELIVVMAIIAILVLLAAPRFLGYTKDANVTAMEQDAKVLADAAELYHLKEGTWPTVDEAEPSYIGYGGVGYIYPVDELKLQSSIKNIEGDYGDYGIAVDGKYRGQVFHLNGVESKDDELVFGGNIKLTDYNARPKPQLKPGVNLVENGREINHDGRQIDILDYGNLIPVDPKLKYRMSHNIKADKENDSRTYGMVVSYDIDGKLIKAENHMYVKDTLTTLAKDLTPGDTVVHLTDTTRWINDAGIKKHRMKLIFWDYTDSTGYTYPSETYSRNVSPYGTWSDGAIDYSKNTIKLNEPWKWEEGTIKAGTLVSNGDSGGAHKYINGINFLAPSEWNQKTGTITGTDYSGNNVLTQFPPGTHFIRPGWLLNQQGTNTGNKIYISDVRIEIVD